MNEDVLIIYDEEWFFAPFRDQLAFKRITYDYCHNGYECRREK